MKLLTKKIKAKLPAICATENIPLNEKIVLCKFFNPCGAGTWYVIEGEKDEDDFIFWGLVDLHEREFGHFSLNELMNLRLPFGLQIERDLYFSDTLLKKVLERKTS